MPRVLPEGYKEDFDADERWPTSSGSKRLAADAIDLRLYRDRSAPDRGSGVSRSTSAVTGSRSSQVLPVLQSLGVEVLDERPYLVVPRPTGCSAGSTISVCRPIRTELRGAVERRLDADAASTPRRTLTAVRRFTEAFAAVWYGHAEADRFNELVLRGGLEWRQVVVLRAYAKYLRQAGFPYSQFHIEGVVLAHPQTAGAGRTCSRRCSTPTPHPSRAADAIAARAAWPRSTRWSASMPTASCARMFGLVRGDTAHQPLRRRRRRRAADFLSLKFDPRQIGELPKPRPRFEIFVYSPEVEGVHLRFGAVARGGLRWSDRREDFRTEILGLVKAQAVKNAVIVPVGAKGGFVVKHPPQPTGDPADDRSAAP